MHLLMSRLKDQQLKLGCSQKYKHYCMNSIFTVLVKLNELFELLVNTLAEAPPAAQPPATEPVLVPTKVVSVKA